MRIEALLRRLLAFAAVLSASAWLSWASPASAQTFGYHVALDASPLAASDAGPFSLEFQLTSGIAEDAGRTQVKLCNFTFGGGSATGNPTLVGGASGDLSSSVTLVTSSFLNDFQQAFDPAGFLEFDICLVTTASDPARDPADGFSFAILDNTGTEIPTLGFFDIGSDVLLSADITGSGAPAVLTYDTDDSQPPAGSASGTPIVMAAPVITDGDPNCCSAAAVPEPGSYAVLAGLLVQGAILIRIRRR